MRAERYCSSGSVDPKDRGAHDRGRHTEKTIIYMRLSTAASWVSHGRPLCTSGAAREHPGRLARGGGLQRPGGLRVRRGLVWGHGSEGVGGRMPGTGLEMRHAPCALVPRPSPNHGTHANPCVKRITHSMSPTLESTPPTIALALAAATRGGTQSSDTRCALPPH